MTGWRGLLAPGLAALVAFAILVGLGAWQLRRLAWKEGLIARIEARAHAAPGAVVPEAGWPTWDADADEFREVRLAGAFEPENEAYVQGLAPAPGGGAILGFYVFTPLRLADGGRVLVNRGFVPPELRDPAARPQDRPAAGEAVVTGLVRAPEARGLFLPADVPSDRRFFARDPAAIGAALALPRLAPFYLEADATQNPGGWPRGGQTRLDIPNNHLQYALTWFGIAATLVGVFAVFARRRLRPDPGALVHRDPGA